jgi:hypothetical protein
MNPASEEAMRDAAFAPNIPADWPGAVGGYYGGARAYNMWSVADWRRFPRNRKLPIWVKGSSGTNDGHQALASLRYLGVTPGAWTALDMETAVSSRYVVEFGAIVRREYRVWVYGSASTVFGNPALDGFWVADYAGRGPFMYDRPGAEVRATQYATGPLWDSSTVKTYTYDQGIWWK